MIRVLLADDEHLIRTALAQMLDLEDDLDGRRRGRAAATRRSSWRRDDRPSTSPCSTCRCPSADGIAVAEQLRRNACRLRAA